MMILLNRSLLARQLQHLYAERFSRCRMQTNPVSSHKFLLLGIVFCVAILVSSHDAMALSIGDQHELGFLWPGIQKKTDNQNKTVYLNHLIRMALGTVHVANGEVYSRSSHDFESLPVATEVLSGRRGIINLGTGSLYTYLFATYNGYGTEVWYVGNLNGMITIPFRIAAHYLTGWTLFSTGTAVPDGGLTATLLGAALGVLALARRFLMR
jgi:hypothetical protein